MVATEIWKYVEIKQYILHQPKSKRIIHKEIGEFTEMKKKLKTHNIPNLWNAAKTVLEEKCKYKSPC